MNCDTLGNGVDDICHVKVAVCGKLCDSRGSLSGSGNCDLEGTVAHCAGRHGSGIVGVLAVQADDQIVSASGISTGEAKTVPERVGDK